MFKVAAAWWWWWWHNKAAKHIYDDDKGDRQLIAREINNKKKIEILSTSNP